ncbi:MAG: FliM/FliN family flagellar motor C-terminal domain-containing protein [Bryobacteraceae bacterium]|jgi:flagellar motor switch/type III secretory pathway protein FliN
MDNSGVLSDALHRFAELPFPVEVELGNLTLSIGEVFDLSEGMVLATDHPDGAPFMLRAGGAELASVEVVVVRDTLSVRVRDMLQKAKPGTVANGTN